MTAKLTESLLTSKDLILLWKILIDKEHLIDSMMEEVRTLLFNL
jgi:hypothetical protein